MSVSLPAQEKKSMMKQNVFKTHLSALFVVNSQIQPTYEPMKCTTSLIWKLKFVHEDTFLHLNAFKMLGENQQFLPPTVCRMASGAQVSHFLHPILAKTYAEAFPSTSWIIYRDMN